MCTILITVSGEFIREAEGDEYLKRIFLDTVHTTIMV